VATDSGAVSENVLYVSIVLTGVLTILSPVVTGLFQSWINKQDNELQRKKVMREKAEELYTAIETAYGRSHDAFIAAANKLNKPDTEAVVRPYEIGRVRVLAAYFRNSAPILKEYDEGMAKVTEKFGGFLNNLPQNDPQPDLIKAMHLKMASDGMEHALRLKTGLQEMIDGEIKSYL